MSASAADAEEMTQDAFVRAYRALAAYEADADPELRPAAVADDDRAQRLPQPRRAAGESGGAPLRPDSTTDGRGAAAPTRSHEPGGRTRSGREAASAGPPCVASLPPAYRAAVLLRHVDGMSYDEMAAVLDRPEGTVKAQVHRGVALLRAAFEADERAGEELTA